MALKMKYSFPALLGIFAVAMLLQGCGGGGGGTKASAVSGTVADLDRHAVLGARVTADGLPVSAETLATGIYRMENVQSGWRTFRATATINGEKWVGSTAVEVLKDEPTMNVNIVLIPEHDTTEIHGTVRDDTGHSIEGARVLLTTRTLSPADETSAYDGPYGSIVAITDSDGRYVLENVPVGISATIAASSVGFTNKELEIREIVSDEPARDFSLTESDLSTFPEPPILTWVESWTMPSTLQTASAGNPGPAIKALLSPHFRASLGKSVKSTRTVIQSTPRGSLIEADLYWNALDVNESKNMAGYGIYRSTGSSSTLRSIDFIRDPYANFYSDVDIDLTPDTTYRYAVSAVDVQFLTPNNEFDPNAESEVSNELPVTPLGQLQVREPASGASYASSGDITFRWNALSGADEYVVLVFDQFPTLPLDPSESSTTPGVFPVWPRRSDPADTSNIAVGEGTTSLAYAGPALSRGTYYYIVVARTAVTDTSESAAYSYSSIKQFSIR